MWALILFFVFVTACEWIPAPTLIESFAADPAVVGMGESVTLSWSVVGADSLRLMPGGIDVSGETSVVVEPVETTTYELVAENGSGSASRAVEVRVVGEQDAPVIVSFGADPGAVDVGGAVTLSWSVVGADSLRLVPGGIDVSGETSVVVEPVETTTYELVAENGSGSASRAVEVRVGPPAIVAFASVRGLVNPGLDATLTWSVTGADTLVLRGPGLGSSGVSVAGETEWTVTASEEGATFTLVAGNTFGEDRADRKVARDVPAVSVLVAGQSNASGTNLSSAEAAAFITADPRVKMLGNDYRWKPAAEPLDDASGQKDYVSFDTDLGVSAGVSLGNATVAATGGEAFLIPAARGGSLVSEWLPEEDQDRYDTESLFGSAANRGRLADLERGAPLGHVFGGRAFGAVYWYQGEEDANPTHIDEFVPQTEDVLHAFQEELDAPIILAQLARIGSGSDSANLYFQRVREAQRAFETDARTPGGETTPWARDRTRLVVTHDLPMHDNLHLSAPAQEELGRRISLAIRQHLLGEVVDGSGPRLVRVDRVDAPSSTAVLVRADRPLTPPSSNDATAYDDYFTVIADGEVVPIDSIDLDASDPKVVRLTLSSAIAGGVQVEVRYMPPPVKITDFAADVIRALECDEPIPGTDLCLPMPAFGAAASAPELGAMSTYEPEVYE